MKIDDARRIGGSPYIVTPPPGGFGAKFYAAEAGTSGVVGIVIIDPAKEGPPGHAHGGAVATLIDEAMGASAWFAGYRVVAVSLSFSLKLAVPLNVEVTLRGRVERKEGRKVFTTGELSLPDGRIAAEGTGVFVEAPQLVGDNSQFNPFSFINPV